MNLVCSGFTVVLNWELDEIFYLDLHMNTSLAYDTEPVRY